MFGGHHQDHADTLNGILGEEAAVTEPNAALRRRVRADDRGRRRRGRHPRDRLLPRGGRRLHLPRRDRRCSKTSGNAGALATILPVESQHATVLATVLGKTASEYLIDFLTTDAALDPADYPAE